MKIKHSFTVGMLSLGLVAAAGAQDIKFNIPGDSSSAQPAAPAPSAPAAPSAFTTSQVCEEFGWFVGKRYGASELQFSSSEIDAIVKGFATALAGKAPPYEISAIGPQMDAVLGKKQAAYVQQLKMQNDAASADFFAKLKSDKDVVVLPSGLCYKIVKDGEGAYPKPTEVVTVNYSGSLLDGTVFDSSAKHGRGAPVDFEVDRAIPGWTEGMQKINKGGKIKLFVPANLAYGDEGRPGIPPGSALVFDVELVDIKPAGSAAAAPAASPTP